MYKERWWACKVHQVNAGRTWGGSSYPRNVGSAAAASLATPPANFSASKTSTLKFILSNIYNICTQAHWSVRFCQGWKVNGVWKSLIISHTKFYLPHLEGKRLGANGKRNDPITNLYCRVAIHPVDSAVIEVCTNLLTCTMRFAVAMQRSSPSKMIQGIKRRIYRIREVFSYLC